MNQIGSRPVTEEAEARTGAFHIRIWNAWAALKAFRAVLMARKEVTFLVTPKELVLREMDQGHYTMVELKIINYSDRYFRVEGEGTYVVSFADLVRRLEEINSRRPFTPDDSLAVSYSGGSGMDFYVLYSGKSGGAEEVTFNLPIRPTQPIRKEVNLTFDAEAYVDPAELYRFLGVLGAFSETVKVVIVPDCVVLSARGEGELGDDISAEFVYGPLIYPMLKVHNGTGAKAYYSIYLLKRFLRHVKDFNTRIKVKLSTNRPLLFECQLSFGYLNYYVAPRISNCDLWFGFGGEV